MIVSSQQEGEQRLALAEGTRGAVGCPLSHAAAELVGVGTLFWAREHRQVRTIRVHAFTQGILWRRYLPILGMKLVGSRRHSSQTFTYCRISPVTVK